MFPHKFDIVEQIVEKSRGHSSVFPSDPARIANRWRCGRTQFVTPRIGRLHLNRFHRQLETNPLALVQRCQDAGEVRGRVNFSEQNQPVEA
jgi:hypothetical protein